MSVAAFVLRALVRGYQLLLSPVLPASCRFYPSCSAYAMQALARHGAIKGTWLSARRICRCHPWNEGGYDPVPGTVPETNSKAEDGCPPSSHPDRMS